jgi:hypothetical protein
MADLLPQTHVLGEAATSRPPPAAPALETRGVGETLAHGLHTWRLLDVPYFFQCADDIQLTPS